ncbi:plasmid replication initiator RepA [Lelliottia nimipressuralis]|uniref:Replication initiation protein n=1 Tax=Lelliottia nimipressuralis TaxID=69220 RepID=A0ABD4KG17_9ENTR|nr:plasmid replication initiator RepA [Lelliottia nimipressuralis]MBF4180363.1 replication initiation protein [Lelliottia nimipressuralis]
MNNSHNPEHWSQLNTEEQIRFWQGVDDGNVDSFLVSPEKKRTRRRRGEHSTRTKCENPAWFRPSHYKKLGGQLGYAYNRLVRKDPETGVPSLRIHMSRHPHYIQGRIRAGRKNRFKPEKARLVDSLWPLLVSFCDAGMHTVGMCMSRLARELSVKDVKGNVIKETEVTVSRLSRVIAEQERYGTLARSAEKQYDHLTKTWLPKYVWITEVGFNILGVDLIKLAKEQEKALRKSEVRQQLIEEGLMEEWEDISPHTARKRHAEKLTLQAIKYRREKAAKAKRAKRLATLPWDAQVEAMAEHILKTMPREEAYYATKDRLDKLAIQQLYQMELYQSGAPPN